MASRGLSSLSHTLRRQSAASTMPEGPQEPQGITMRTLSMVSRMLAALLMLGEHGGPGCSGVGVEGGLREVAHIVEALVTPAVTSKDDLGSASILCCGSQ